MAFILRDAEKIICAFIFLAMTLIGFANVAVRYLTSQSLAATEELLVNGFLLLTIFGAAIAARKGEHLAVTLIFDMLPSKGRLALLWISSSLSLLLLLLSAWYSLGLLQNQLSSGTVSYALQIPAWYYSVGMPFGFVLIAFRYVQHMFEVQRELSGQEASGV